MKTALDQLIQYKADSEELAKIRTNPPPYLLKTPQDYGRLLELIERYQTLRRVVIQLRAYNRIPGEPPVPPEIIGHLTAAIAERCGMRDRDNLDEWLTDTESQCSKYVRYPVT